MADETLEQLKEKRAQLIELKRQRDLLVSERDQGGEDSSFKKVASAINSVNPAHLMYNATAGGVKGLSDIGNNLTNALSYVLSGSKDKPVREFAEKIKDTGKRPDVYEAFGLEDEPWYTPAGSAQLTGEMAPSGEIGAGVSRALGAGEKLLPYLKGGKLSEGISKGIANMANSGVAGGAMSAIGGENPSVGNIALGAAGGALLPPAAQLLMKGAHKGVNAIGNLGATLRNHFLDAIEKSSAQGVSNTPEETMQNIERNYTNKEGERMPIDIGTATAHPLSRDVYSATEMFPLSDAANKKNMIVNQKADIAIDNAQRALADAEKQANDIRGESSQDLAKHGTDINKMQEDYKQIHQDHEALNGAINQAPRLVNTLIADVPKNVSLPEYVTKETRKEFDNLRSEASRDYETLDNMDVTFNGNTASSETFPLYNEERLRLENDRDSLNSLFGNDKDLPRDVLKEMESSGNLIKGEPIDPETSYESIGAPLSLKSIRTHTSNLGKLWARAKESGNDNLARMLMDMRKALVSDTKNLLSETGNEDALNLWNNADANWSASSDFFNSPEMRKVVGKKTTRGGYIAPADKLAKELNNPNNVSVLERLNPNAQKAASHLIITSGKGATRESKMTPVEIAARVKSMTGEQHAVLNQHSPGLGEYLTSLPDKIVKEKTIGDQKKSLAKIIDRVKVPNAKRLESSLGNVGERARDLKRIEDENLKGNNLKSSLGRYARNALGTSIGVSALASPLSPVAGAIASAIGGGSLIAKKLEKVLSDPGLLNKYIAKERYPKKKMGKTPSITEAISGYISRK